MIGVFWVTHLAAKIREGKFTYYSNFLIKFGSDDNMYSRPPFLYSKYYDCEKPSCSIAILLQRRAEMGQIYQSIPLWRNGTFCNGESRVNQLGTLVRRLSAVSGHFVGHTRISSWSRSRRPKYLRVLQWRNAEVGSIRDCSKHTMVPFIR